jgi:hypothetical protein
MKEFHKIQMLFKRDLDGSITGRKGKMLEGEWTNNDLKYLANNEWIFTEKIDGTNIRVCNQMLSDTQSMVRFGGRTDNAMIPKKLLAFLQDKFTPEVFSEAGLTNVTLYGEGFGAGIQKGGGNYSPNQEFVLFDVVVHGQDQDWWLYQDDVEDVANKLDIPYAPVICSGTLYDAIDMVKAGLKSQWGDFEAEGIVARPVVQLWNRKGERIITKIKGVDFK